MTQTALDMPDGLRPPFYTIVWRYGSRQRREHAELEDALRFCASGEDYGEHSVEECGDQDSWLWRRGGELEYEAHERAPARPNERYFYAEDDSW